MRAGRRLRAGLPEGFAPEGFRRGSISLMRERQRLERSEEYVALVLAHGPLRV